MPKLTIGTRYVTTGFDEVRYRSLHKPEPKDFFEDFSQKDSLSFSAIFIHMQREERRHLLPKVPGIDDSFYVVDLGKYARDTCNYNYNCNYYSLQPCTVVALNRTASPSVARTSDSIENDLHFGQLGQRNPTSTTSKRTKTLTNSSINNAI